MKRSPHDHEKRDFRAAMQIAAALVDQSPPDTTLAPMQESLSAIAKHQKCLLLSEEREWQRASHDSADRMRSAANVLSRRAMLMADELRTWSGQPKNVSASMIYHELVAIRKEFAVVEIDLAAKQIVVETVEIVLDDVFLGPFQLCLKWKFIQQSSPYDVISPNSDYASSTDGMTHPHVQREKLCEGEGATVISRALKEGRLFDFFTVVDRILKTYNPDSVSSEDVCSCTKCETNHCVDCSTCCDSCSDRFCSDCISTCECCDSDICHYCRESCAECDSYFSPSCLTDGVCDDCTDKKNQTTETQLDSTTASLASFYSVCDGKATVPA